MEYNKSDYQNVLHLLLDKLSANIDNISLKVPYPKIINSMNSKQLVGAMKELDSWISSPEQNLTRFVNASDRSPFTVTHSYKWIHHFNHSSYRPHIQHYWNLFSLICSKARKNS